MQSVLHLNFTGPYMTFSIHAKTLTLLGAALTFTCLSTAQAQAEDYRAMCTKFVHKATGKGKTASPEKPAKDLGNIISRLEAGDVVCIAEGEYLGRGENGVDDINLAVSVIGGFSPDFTKRDPWGAHKTIFTGMHNSENFATQTRLSIETTKTATRLMETRGQPTAHTIIVDGLIFDNGPRNYYKTDKEALIVRKGTASDTPTPESGALVVRTGVNSTVIVKNNVATNFAPTEGVFSFFGGKGADVTVENNVAVNNTGAGFRIGTAFTGEDIPTYKVKNNISMFNQKHTAFGTFGGSGIMLESSTAVEMTGNVFAYNDNFGVDNAKRSKNAIMNGNIISTNANADYLEFSSKMDFDEIEDESDLMDEAEDNLDTAPTFKFSGDWVKYYLSRSVIDRNAAEADVKVAKSWQNDVRSMFGLNLQGSDLNVDSATWLPRMSLSDAMSAAKTYDGGAGVKAPKPQTFIMP